MFDALSERIERRIVYPLAQIFDGLPINSIGAATERVACTAGRCVGTGRGLVGLGYCDASGNYHAAMATMSQIHETAVVEAGSEIGDGTLIWHHAHVRAGASIGAGCVIGKNVYIDQGVRIGTGCKIQNNVSVYNGVTIGNDVFVGPSVTFTNDRVPRAFSSDWTITPTDVLDGASLGANATIVCGVTIGRFAMVAAGATVTHDVADHQLVAGTPARHHGWVDRDGNVVSREAAAP